MSFHSRLLLTLIAWALCQAPCLAAPASSRQAGTWDAIQKQATDALDANQYWLAEPLLKQAAIKAAGYGESDIRLAKSLAELGRLYTIRGRFDTAEPYLEESLYVTGLALGKSNDRIVPAMGSLVRFYLLYGTAGKADPLAGDILSFIEGKLADEGLATHARVTIKKGAPIELWAATAAPAMRDPVIDWAITCDDLGNLYLERGNLDLAERFFKTALDIKTTVFGKDHLSLANSYDSLGKLCLKRGQAARAETYFTDALTITENILSPDEPQVYARLDKLARCLIECGKQEQAEKLYLRAQGFWREEPSTNGDDARAAFALGNLYATAKRYPEAAPILEKALQLAEQFHGPNSISLVPYLQRYAYCLYYLGRKPESDQLKARASAIANPATACPDS